jgi:Rap1a immunity proteins
MHCRPHSATLPEDGAKPAPLRAAASLSLRRYRQTGVGSSSISPPCAGMMSQAARASVRSLCHRATSEEKCAGPRQAAAVSSAKEGCAGSARKRWERRDWSILNAGVRGARLLERRIKHGWNMLKNFGLVVGLLAWSANCCWARATTTKDLIEECRQADLLDPDKAPQNSTMVEGTLGLECLSYFDGFVAGYGETTMAFGAKELICLPAGTDVFQVVAAYVKWGDHNREKGHLPPRTTAMMAMREAFPCK